MTLPGIGLNAEDSDKGTTAVDGTGAVGKELVGAMSELAPEGTV